MGTESSESYSFKLKSHTGKLLVDHLSNAGKLCRDTVAGKVLDIEDADILKDVAYLMGVTHDLGKATSFFQEYLAEEDEKRKRSLKGKENTRHGLLSSFFAYAVVRDYVERSEKREIVTDYLPIIAFLAVKRHHGNLLNAIDEISEVGSEREKISRLVEVQLASMDRAEIAQIFELLLSKDEVGQDFDSESIINYILKDAISDIRRKSRRSLRDLQRKCDLFPYFVAQFLYSALLDADKTDAGLSNVNLERMDIPEDIVDKYRETKGFDSSAEGMNLLRDRIYKDAVEAMSTWDLRNKIISLNVPTGTGKTITSLSIALKLRHRLGNEYDMRPRIIYALPFLSIIDQNFEVFEEVIALDRAPIDSRLLLKHHHLAEVRYRIEDDEFEADKSQLLIEGWNAEIIVTTFWQLFNTMFNNHNRQLRKFNKLANAIIILDEVQAIPHHYWALIHDAFGILCGRFNSYLVLVTATQPLIFDEEKGEIREIVRRKEEYFQGLDRIRLTPMIGESLSLEKFTTLLASDLQRNRDKDYLVVLNTISSAREVYDFVRNLNLEDTESFYLSTHIVPKERIRRIKKIKEKLKNNKRKVIVSTQLIEAGVDIDADVVWRDFGPLDSINQVCGRCNRNSSKGVKGEVFVFVLKDDRQEFYRYIYDPFLISKTYDILKPLQGSIRESSFLELNKKYFESAKLGMGDTESKANLECLSMLAFRDLEKGFNLIKQDAYKADIFIETDKEAARIWKRYMEIRFERDPMTRKSHFLEIKKDFSDHVISVPRKLVVALQDQEIGYVPMNELPYYYDFETGFKTKDAGEGSMVF